MVKQYMKGYRAERSLVHELSKKGFMVVRTPHSGSMNIASPDIIAAKGGKLFVIECKSREDAFTVQKEQLDEMRQWVDKAGAEAYIGWKISRRGWSFLKLDDVAGNNGNIGKKFAREKGIPIDSIFSI